MIDEWSGVRGDTSRPQSKAVSITTDLGMHQASSR
jgi:hypothetical protein